MATAKWVRITARKARLVSRAVVGMPVAEALTLLRFMPRAAADDVLKVIKSAAANAEHNYKLDSSLLRIARIEVDDARILKRSRAGSRSHVKPIAKRTTHLRAVVSDTLGQPVTRRAASAPVDTAARPSRKATTVKSTTTKAVATPVTKTETPKPSAMPKAAPSPKAGAASKPATKAKSAPKPKTTTAKAKSAPKPKTTTAKAKEPKQAPEGETE